MSEHLRNQLSAFIDGELPKHEIELLFKRLDGNTELRATLARYTVIGESLRTQAPQGPSRAFAGRVRAAVQANGPLATRGTGRSASVQWQWMKPAAGMAVAATVAAVALVGLQRLQNPVLDEAPVVAASQTPASGATPGAGSEGESVVVPAPALAASSIVNAARLTNYVVAHSEYSSLLGRRYVLSGIVAESPPPVETPAADRSELTIPANQAAERQ